MNKPWLIQRIIRKQQPSENRKGIDKNFSMDYMGSAEFEFGALPAALDRIRKDADKYVMNVLDIHDKHGKPCRIICKEEDVGDLKKLLAEMSQTNYGDTKNAHMMKDGLAGKGRGLCAWWDIENNWFLVKGKHNAKLLWEGLFNQSTPE